MDFSVVIPTYNSASIIDKALSSIKEAAGNKEFEVIIVDDCSDDIDVLKEVIANYTNAWLIEKEAKTNASDSRNIGFLKSNANVVFFLDSDDCYTADYISHRLEITKEKKAGIVFGNFIVVQGENRQKSNIPMYISEEDMRDFLFLRGGDVRSSTITINKAHYLGTLFDEKMRKHQDWGFSIIAYDKGETFFFDEYFGVVINIEDRPERMSKRHNLPASEYFIESFLFKDEHKNSFCIRQATGAAKNKDRSTMRFFLSLISYKEISSFQLIKVLLLRMNIFYLILKCRSYAKRRLALVVR